MSTSAAGAVVDENNNGIAGLGVYLEDISRVLVVSLGKTTTDSAGKFSLTYADDLPPSNEPGRQIRKLRLRLQVGQHVIKQVEKPDTTQSPLTFDEIKLQAAEANTWWATLGTGQPSRLTHANALRWLVDNEEAWGRVEKVIEEAKTLDVMQLQIDVEKYAANFRAEKPRLVLQFDHDPQPLNAVTRRKMDDDDKRIERSMLEAAKRGAEVRIQIPKMRIDRQGAVTIAAISGLGILMLLGGAVSTLLVVVGAVIAVLGIATLALLLYVDRSKFSNMFHRKELAEWFQAAIKDLREHPITGTPLIGVDAVRVTDLEMRSNNVTHSKLVIDRGIEAVLLGSPFEQHYFDSLHALDDPRRGRNSSKGPIHDVSVSVRGGAVGHMEELFNSHWNLAKPSDPLLETPPIPSAPTTLADDEYHCSVQVVRTLDRMFAEATDGEKGVLEAYLRAIHFAKRFIYIENQYFNNDAITEALIAALKNQPQLKVILLLNPAPDMPLYLGWQQKAVRRIAASLGDAATAAQRFGVFSTWTHASSSATGGSKPTLVDNYLHTKSALIDNCWATVGSANLDGASLDFLQYARPMLDGDVRNSEANVVVFEETPPPKSAVDGLRRRLWAEHLGFEKADGSANMAASELDDAPGKDWLAVWRQRAQTKRDGLMQNLDAVSPIRILEFPTASFEESLGRCRVLKMHHSHATAVAFLRSLLSPDEQPSDVLVSQLNVLGEKGPPAFEFEY